MFEKGQFEIPENVRELAERNVEQARTAYSHFMQVAMQAQQMMFQSSGMMVPGPMAASAMQIQTRAMDYARRNLDTSFNFAADLARARDLKEYLEVRGRYAQQQMQAFQQQAEELGKLMTEAAQKAQPKA